MFKCKVKLSNRATDSEYKKFIEALMEVSDLEESEIVERKDEWEEYEVWEHREYIIECELSEEEYVYLIKNFTVIKY